MRDPIYDVHTSKKTNCLRTLVSRKSPRVTSVGLISGDVVVDTFLLPSACVCHFRESPLAEITSRLGGAEVRSKSDSAGQIAESREDKGADADPRCEEEQNSLDSIISSAQSRSALSSFR